MNRKTAVLSAALAIATAAVALGQAPATSDQAQKTAATIPAGSPATIPVTIDDLRQAARLIPGRRPLRINVVKFAESRRTMNFSVKGAPAVPSVQARTAYQVVYPDGTIMIDSGMDQQVHKFFGRGAVEPYDPEAAKQVEKAVRAAKFVVVTHEHGDHAAGVIRTPYVDEIAPKTVFTKTSG
ncbi:MAG TPA: MBL fold metallo-hydrolase [Bryobacteraceae bacterium]|nr:MBL fold metallo-hydrolase [Bryobacteraceae bacterium]